MLNTHPFQNQLNQSPGKVFQLTLPNSPGYSGRVTGIRLEQNMNSSAGQINLILAWLGIVLGFASGFAFGLGFHNETWLGGYASFKRRLYRLAHISFFGLALVNFLFYLTAQKFTHASTMATVASWGFVAGAVTMPVCCFIMAHRPRFRALFLIPVVCLLSAGTLTLWEVVNL